MYVTVYLDETEIEILAEATGRKIKTDDDAADALIALIDDCL